MYNPYIYGKLANAHHQDLLREVEQQGLADQLPHQQAKASQRPARGLAAFMRLLFSSKKVAQPARIATGQL